MTTTTQITTESETKSIPTTTVMTEIPVTEKCIETNGMSDSQLIPTSWISVTSGTKPNTLRKTNTDGWISSQNDPKPTITVTLPKPVYTSSIVLTLGNVKDYEITLQTEDGPRKKTGEILVSIYRMILHLHVQCIYFTYLFHFPMFLCRRW